MDGAKLSEDERKLALTLGNNLEFETTKSALKQIFIKSAKQMNHFMIPIKSNNRKHFIVKTCIS